MLGEHVARGLPWRSAASRSLAGTLGTTGGLQLLVIVSGVLVARALGPEDRGYLALLVVVSSVCGVMGSLGLPLAATYYIARDRTQARPLVSSFLGPAVLQLVATLAVQTAVLVVVVMNEPERAKFAAMISLLLVPGILALSYGLGILQGQQRFLAVNVLRVLPTTAYVAGVVVAFVLDFADLVAIMTIWASANFVGGFLALGVALRGLPTAPVDGSPPSRSEVSKFGLKSLLGSVSPVDTLRLDQAVVGLFLNPVALGLYVVAQAFTNLPRVVATSVGLVAYPHVASEPDSGAARRAMWRYFFFGAAISVLVVGALEIATGYLVTLFFGSEFFDAIPTARILLLGTLFVALRRVLTDGVNGLGRPELGTFAELASWVLLVPTLVLLLPRFGVEGVAVALTISWGLSLVFLIALVVTVGTSAPSEITIGKRLVRSLTAWRAQPRVRQLLFLTATAAAASAAGLAVALLSSRTALIAILALSAALFFALGRKALGQTGSAGGRLARARSLPGDVDELSSHRPDTEFRVARRLYYVGLVLLGLLTLRVAGQVTYSDVLFLFSFLLACAEFVIVRRQVPIRLPFILLLGMAIFTFGGLLSTFESYEYVKSTGVIVRLLLLSVFWFWLGTVVLNRREHVIKATGLWVASAAIGGSAAVVQLLAGDVIPGGTAYAGRMTGFTAHPNDLGGLTCIAFVPALMLAARQSISAPRRLFSYAVLLLVAAGLILSGSIGGILAAAAATFVWFAFQRSSVHSILVFTTIGLCVITVTTVQAMRGAPTPLERLDSVTNSGASDRGATVGSVEERIVVYRAAVAEIKEHPFIGVGFDLVSVTKPFQIESHAYDVHNVIIGVWYKAGLIGLAGMLIAFFAVFRAGWISMLDSKSQSERKVAVALVSSVVAFVVFAMSEPVLFSRYGWISAALLFALRAVQQREFHAARAGSHEEDFDGIVLAPARP